MARFRHMARVRDVARVRHRAQVRDMARARHRARRGDIKGPHVWVSRGGRRTGGGRGGSGRLAPSFAEHRMGSNKNKPGSRGGGTSLGKARAVGRWLGRRPACLKGRARHFLLERKAQSRPGGAAGRRAGSWRWERTVPRRCLFLRPPRWWELRGPGCRQGRSGAKFG